MSVRGRSSNSLEVDVVVSELIEILKKNRDQHIIEYNAQVEGWRTLLSSKLREIDGLLTLNSDGDWMSKADKLKTELYRLVTPVSNEVDYTRTIGMLEMHQRAGKTTITLEAQDYARYVDDDWDWKDVFLANSVTYSSMSNR